MSAAELLVRLLVALLCFATGSAVLLPVFGDRRGLAGAAVLLAVGTVSVVVAVRWPPGRGDDR